MNVKDRVAKSICCGCGACVDACPVNAITMDFDNVNWHMHPTVNERLCINCNKCINVCPAISEKKQRSFSPYGYAATADDSIRQKSSSGGIFYVFAKKIISQGGYVSGAVFCDDLVIRHIVSKELNDVERMRDSKYVQSDASGVYSIIAKLLSDDKKVLFSGTPCQVAALRNYLGEEKTKNLICIDILCHGVPSPKVFDYYLTENFDKEQIEKILFRNKEHRKGHPGSITFVMKDGRELYSEYFDNSYYDAFLFNLLERESCFDCKYCEFPRVGDISIGDFWGAKTTNTKIDYENGCSVIIINSKNGEKFANTVLKSLKKTETYSLDTLMSWNRNKKELEKNPCFQQLPEMIKKYSSLRVASDMLLNQKYDVGIFGVTMNPNFGGLITYWALYRAIEKIGYRTAIIARPINSLDSRDVTHSTDFFKKHCFTTEQLDVDKLYTLNEKIDRFVLGSDQVWNYQLFECWENSLYLDFVKNSKLKIAYAASFGGSSHAVPKDRVGQVSKYFKEFDYISVRENDGVDILKNDYSVDSTHVMDPVFLVNKCDYLKLANESSFDCSQNYVCSYIIEPNDFKLSVVRILSEHLQKENYNITDGDPNNFAGKSQWYIDRNMHIRTEATIYDWLKMIINSDFVVTDSYHAVCLCIMFNKPFIILQERWALSRIKSIMDIFGLHNRWLKINEISQFTINDGWFLPLQPQTKDILESQISESYDWLKNVLKSSKTIHNSSNFTPHIDKNRAEDYFFFLLRNRKDYIITVSSCSLDTNILSKIDFKCKLSYLNCEKYKGKAFAMLYDFGNDFLEIQGEDYNEIVYKLNGKKLICIADRSSIPFANKIYVFGKERYVSSLNPDAGVIVSVYSKMSGCIVDSFEIFLENDVAMIKRE